MLPPDNQLLDVSQVASLLELEEADVRWLIDTKQLPARVIHNKTFITREDVRRLLETYIAVARRRSN